MGVGVLPALLLYHVTFNGSLTTVNLRRTAAVDHGEGNTAHERQ